MFLVESNTGFVVNSSYYLIIELYEAESLLWNWTGLDLLKKFPS